MTFQPSLQPFIGDTWESAYVLFSKGNEGVRCRLFTRMFVGKRTRFTTAPDGSGVSPVASEPQMIESRFA